ncbi:fat-like cadherin-related tumor suppressor homolog isoform X2 [Macrobrachium nipponense]|uniref:fat-like cadherin-related tumor suppressor homolog isoform X2 n=1 Tax=Macrobrachium nipponense TaxID=159736 RepID=UPI0030C7B509
MMARGAGLRVAWPTQPCALYAQPRPLPNLLFRLFLALLLLNGGVSATADEHTVQPLLQNYSVAIYENSLPRTYVAAEELIGIPLETLPPTSHITYNIVQGDEDGFFTAESEVVGGVAVLQIRTRTGLRDVLNRERQSQYVLSVEAKVRSNGQGSGRTKYRTQITVVVLDTNDNIPLFYPTSYQISVGEDAPLHTPLISVTAHDADIGYNGQVYYSLENPESNYFAVHPTTGIVSVTRPLSQMYGRSHRVGILAQDRGPQPRNFRPAAAARATVEVQVQRVNLHSPTITVHHLPHVIEHSHTHIYAIINVDDADEGNSGVVDKIDIIGGDPNRLFSITHGSHSKEYNLAVLKLLDRELAPEGYNLTIQATDSGTPPRNTKVNIHVSIADVNDHAPVFALEQYEESVSEEAPPNTPVVVVAASDTDQGINGKVLFRIVAGNEDENFHINPQTGLISTAEWLDHESTAYYSLTVAAVDQASNARRKQSSAKVIIRVSDANDNAPQFNTPNTEVTLDENEPSGTYVTRVAATDQDSGENGFISYSIANLDQVPFSIDPFDGTVRTSSVLDYETQRRVYTIKVRASDWGIPFKRETETTVKVKVRDINDNRPQFEGVDCKGWVSVDAPIGTSVLKLSALDLDADSDVKYKLQRDISEECWAMDASSGVLALTCDLRKHMITGAISRTYVLNVTATDGTHVSDATSVTIAVITDKAEDQAMVRQHSHVECHSTGVGAKASEIVAAATENNAAEEHYALLPLRYGYNAHAPELPETFPSVVEIPEDAVIGAEIIKVEATDHDRGHNGRVVYAVSGGDTDSVFRIGVDSGVLSVWAELDHERTPEYLLNITVYDLGVPHRSISRNLTIRVTDVNDNAPEFSSVSYSLHLPENTRNGTSVAQLSAQDADDGINAKINYKLVTDVEEFTVDQETGILYVSGPLNRERRSEYDLRVRAWDSSIEDPRSALARVLVTVLDMNDCSPEFGAASRLSVDVPEDLPLGAVVATLRATDRDLGLGGQISYSLLDSHSNVFRIDEETGVVRIASALDYETQPSYNLTIRAQDKGSPPLESLASLFVQIHDVDENLGPPAFPQRILRGWVHENLAPGALVTTLSARDPDGGPLHYTIISGDGVGFFTVDKEGAIRTTVVLDRETARGYWLSVVVADNGAVPLTDICHVYVEVQDVNDHIPQTDEPSYNAYVAEDGPPGTSVISLTASDGDLTPSNLTFAITGGNEDAHFQISSQTGVLSTAWTLDRETRPEYELWVTVSDGQLSSVTPVFITVTDVNDNAPEFLESLYRVSVPSRIKSKKRTSLFRDDDDMEEEDGDLDEDDGGESLWAWGEWVSFTPSEITPHDDLVFRVFARDADTGMNADLDYSIKTGRGKGRFKIHPKTGQVYTKKAFTPGQTFDLMVQAKDNGQPQLTATARVLVRVAPVPETSAHPPELSPPAPAHVMETDPPGHLVAFVNAYDRENDTLWYYIVDGDDSGRFNMGVDSGLVSLARSLDHEDQYHYTLTIAATDGVYTTTTKLMVEVMDANDHRPVFSDRVYEGSVSESTKPGATVLALHCRDKDHSPSTPSSSVYFSLHHSDSLASQGLFTIDSSTGDIIVAMPLDREVCSSHVLTVSCRDRGRRENADFARVLLTVTDDNDHHPVFFENTINAKMSAGSAAGTAVTRVLAVDHDKGDNGRLSYSIVEGNAGGLFAMEPSLGVIRLARELVDSDPREYLLLVRAMDHGRQARAASVPVRVIVASSPEAPPSWKEGEAPKVVEMNEWTSVGSAIARLAATSPSSLQYSITGGNDEGVFVVSPSSGVVSLATTLDFETTAWYNLTLTATNLAGVQRDTWLGVTVLDENDWWPEWNDLVYQGTVEQNAAVDTPVLTVHSSQAKGHPAPLTVSATDRDNGLNGRVTYSIVEKNVAQFFSIDEHTGAVRVSGNLEDVAGMTVPFSVWAIDGGDPKRECVAPASVVVTVRSVVAPPVAFSQPYYSTELYLPTYVGVRVLCINRPEGEEESDRDRYKDAEKPPMKYSIVDGDETKRFAFDDSSRCLYVRDQLNLRSHYNLTLKATDGALTSTATAEITVLEAPPSTLVFTQDKYFANVFENSTKEVNLVAVGVKGQNLNHHIEYSILNPIDTFEIRPTAGIVKTTGKPFDREEKDHYTLVIQAKDAEEPTNLAHVLVHVVVMDVNDNEPIFVNQPYIALVSTSAERGHVVTKVRAVDADAEDFGSVRYELVRGSGELFAVNKKSGEISLKQSLMVADKTYSLTVAAYDGGKQPLSSQAHVMIRVVSAEGPIFSSARYAVSINEDAPKGTPVVRVEAESPSADPIMYTIVAGNAEELFALDYATGVIQTAAPLDYETSRSHNLTVRARDPSTGGHTDTQVTITVADVNDNAPEFVERVFKAQVSEVVSKGYSVIKVEAHDVDTGEGGHVRYRCETGCDMFAVGAQDGVVSVAGVLDAETHPQYTMSVVALDGGIPQRSSTATVVVETLDFNDNPPSWRQDSYSCRVSSEAAPGHVISSLSAHDPDSGQEVPLRYSIHSGDRSAIFKIDSYTGVLTVTAPHKLENVTSLNLNVSVSDGVHMVFTAVHIEVVPSNRHTPRFSRPMYEGSIEENAAGGRLILTLEAEDPDSREYGTLHYSILDQTSEGAFTIDKDGNIFSEAPLDRESLGMHTIRVSVTDEGGKASFTDVRVSVRDKNDNDPKFTLPAYQANINTDVVVGTTILKVEAVDPDEGVNSDIQYQMYEANSSEALSLFKVDQTTGEVILSANVRGRENEVYQFFIRGEDGGSPRHHTDVPVTIFLLPSDDHPPQCARKYTQFFVREDAAIGTVITSLWTEGPQEVQYSILVNEEGAGPSSEEESEISGSHDASGPFAITAGGLLVVRHPLDHERHHTHRITVTNHTLTTPPALDYMTISVVVMDVNDCAPRFSSSWYEAIVAENSEVGAVITILTATDDDDGNNGQIQYSLSIEEDTIVKTTFRIDPHSGSITLAAPLDRETISRYSFTVVATDGGPEPLSTTAKVTVLVKDYNDNPPVFPRDTYLTAVPEDTATGTAVLELSVDDADEVPAQLDYFVTGGDLGGHFLVHASGQVYVAAPLDRETQDEYTLTVTATDGKFTANTTVIVTVIDINDNGPVCREPLYKREVSEGVTVGTHVVSVMAWDADEGSAARSRYILSGDGAEDFTIDQLSGHMATARQLDRETTDHYSLTVLVEDWEHPEWECEVEVEVDVSDINDNPPSFPSESDEAASATVPEDAPVNTVLMKMYASDPDLGISRRIRYRFVDSAEGHFSIDETEGVISLARPLDRETKDSYSLTVQAVDMGVPPLSSTTVLTVTVTDVNDNAPEFVRKLLETTVAENLDVGTEVLRVMATSEDIGVNADITYSIHHTTKEKYLAIHPKTGVISVGAPLDYERVHQVVATVIATDGGTPPLSSTALVNLTLTDVNDNAPIFTLPSYTAAVREDALQGASVIQISASDVDAGINSLVRYSISDGNDEHCFHIDQDTGIITVLKKLDREKIGEYDLQVSARDLGSPPNTAVTQVKITVTDVNDNPPIFTNSNYSVIVQENRPVGHPMLRLMATDADADPNGAPFTWELIKAASEHLAFTLDQDGSLKVATNKLNHLVQSEYTLSVRVWDNGSPPLNANTKVKIVVVEESQYPPTLFPLQASITSYRTAFQGGIIGRLSALDQDPYDTLQFSVSSSPKAASAMKYFAVDGQDGTLVAMSPLDEGIYKVNVSVSDGKFDRMVEASVQVFVISEDMVENSVIVQIGPLSPGEFLSKYQRIFVRAVAAELSVEEEAISILSLQPTLMHSQSKEKISYKSQRNKRGIQQNLDILLVVSEYAQQFFSRKKLLESLQEKQHEIQNKINLPYLSIMDTMCTKETDCSGHGHCVDVVEITEDVSVPYNTQMSSLLSPKFIQKAGCLCDQGYGGDTCEDLVNACGHRPCAEYEECLPTDVNTLGYTCQCPKGRAGPLCKVDLTKCRSPSCHYPMRPLSFKGKSYAQYVIARQTESSSLVLSVFLRTRHPVGTIVYAAGDIDYSILEVAGGHIQYRWDCGSGEGLVRVSTIRVDDNEWHFINLTRDGTVSTLSVDGEVSSGAAPGVNDILNMDSDFMFLGATISRDQRSGMSSYSHSSLGFVGCLDQMTIDGAELPITISGTSSSGAVLKRLANVELQCPDILPPAGVCGSQPCLNGGTCIESNKSYKCNCPPRFTGSQCQVDTAPCSSSPCLNGGKCIVVGRTYKCQCPSKLSGKRCEYGVYCNPNPCQNGGRCEEGADGPICKCQHFTGNMCQLDIDECTRNPCQNGGTCLNFYGGFKCICHSNVTGEYCTEPKKKSSSPSALNISLEELVCILAVFVGCVIAMLVLVAWQRRRWHQKRHQQNNRVKLTDHHVKNDLKANDVPKRNSKICNVEADQGPPLPPRPASYTPSGNDSVILNTLKHLADLSAAGHESLELETLSRCSHELLHSLNKPVVIPPNLSPPPPSNSDSDSLHKPWDHHNNLNDSYFMPIKDVSCDLVTSVDESRLSPAQQSTFSDGSSVRGGVCGSSPPAVPPLPPASLLGRSRGRGDVGTPLEVIAIGPEGTATTVPSHNTPTLTSAAAAEVPHQIRVCGKNGRLVPSSSGYPPTQAKRKEYLWDDYDMRGSRTLLSYEGAGEVVGAAATPDLLLLPGGDGPVSDDDFTEGKPLLSDAAYGVRPVRNFGEAAAATPLLTVDARDADEYPDDDDDDEDDDDDDPCSFEEILLANNITLGSTPELDNTAMYNIVSDIDDDYLEPLSTEISSVPCPLAEEEEEDGEGDQQRLPLEEKHNYPHQNHYQQQPQEKDISRLGSPRSRRPFHRTDYGRVSDLSFLSALEEDGVDDSLSELQDSECEPFVDEKETNQPSATLIQTSLSEVYL